MSFTASEEIVVAVNKDVSSGTCTGVIIQSNSDKLQIALRGAGLVLRHGSLLHLKSCSNSKLSAWGCVHHVGLAGDVKLVQVNSVRYEGQLKARAARLQIEIMVTTKFNDREQKVNKTVGQTVNISVSGVLAKFKTILPEGASVHVVLHLAPGKEVEAIARVARIASAGHQVGLEFQRFIRGYELLIGMSPSEHVA